MSKDIWQPYHENFILQKRKLEALPPNGGNAKSTAQEYSDTLPGLKLFVSKAGGKSFHFRYIISGRKRVIKIGDFDCIPLEEVREIIKNAQTALNLHLTQKGGYSQQP